MSIVVTDGEGRYLNQVRGGRRGWTYDLNKAQVFETVGKGKVAYNHAMAPQINSNRWNRETHQRNPNVPLRQHPIPDFQTLEVMVVLKYDRDKEIENECRCN